MKKKKIVIFMLLIFFIPTYCFGGGFYDSKQHQRKKERYSHVKKLREIKGPASAGYYNYVHIVSRSIGVYAYGPTIISNSVIDAPICVVSDGYFLQMHNNILRCQLCIRFDGRVLMNNHLDYNNCAGAFTNRPDVFG